MSDAAQESSDSAELALGTELATYQRERDKLLGSADGKFVLIHGDDVVGVFESELDAISQGYRQFGNVPFLVRRVARIDTPMNFVSNLICV